ncbi:MAG: amino acid permease [Acidobacteria bacterium]|nr:amino acid permease [Acidobacteriota bacterium]
MSSLSRTLHPRDLLLLFIGSVIGSGIFLTPGLILRQLDGSVGAAFLVWIVGGVLSLLGALTYAELSATNPEAGGLYCFIRDGFGRIPAFLYGWSLFLVIASGTIAALSHAFTRYLAEIVPFPPAATKLIAVGMIAVVTVVNVWGTRKSSDLQNWTTLIKALAVVLLSAILLALGHHASELPAALPATQHGSALFSAFGLAMIAVLWAYEGWQFGTYSAGEVIDPQKSFPRAFLLGSLILVALYLVANIAYLIALGPAAATASDAIAATAASTTLGPWAGKFVAFAILISVFSSTNSVILTAPRVFYAMANDNLFFKKLAEVHPRYGTPAAAIIALGVWSAILACAGKFAELIGGVIFVGWIFYGLAAAAIFPLRRKSPNAKIPYRVPGYPFTPLLFVLAAAAIVANAVILAFYDPASFQHIVVAVILFVLGLPAYAFWRRNA